MDTVPLWTFLVVLGVIGSLITWLWRGADRRIADHTDILDDLKTRVAKMEEKVERNRDEISTLRKRWHELTNQVSHSLAEWFNEVVKMIKGDK